MMPSNFWINTNAFQQKTTVAEPSATISINKKSVESCRTDRKLILLTGATGYIGGRLLKALEQAGYPVRCLARRPESLKARAASGTQIAKADCLDPASLAP